MQRRTPLIALGIAALLALGACGGDDDDPVTDDSDALEDVVDTDDSDGGELLDENGTVTVRTSKISFELDVPESMALGSLLEGAGGDGSCGSVRAHFSDDASLALEAFHVDCPTDDNSQIGNGNHGTYRSIDDVDAPIEPQDVETGLGPAVIFQQEYFECTNECNDYTDTVAIVTLDEPRNRAYPALVLRSDKGEMDRDVFAAIVGSLTDPLR